MLHVHVSVAITTPSCLTMRKNLKVEFNVVFLCYLSPPKMTKKFPQNKWFDSECKELKAKRHGAHKVWIVNALNSGLRARYFDIN